MVALVCVACSLAVIAVAIPRNSREKDNAGSASPTTEVQNDEVKTRQTVSHSVVYLGTEGTPGIAMSLNGRSIVVSAMAQVSSTPNAVVSVSDENTTIGEAIVVGHDEESGLVILSAPASLAALLRDVQTTTTPIADGDQLLVFDPSSNALERVREGIALTKDRRAIPLDLGHAVPGATVVSNEAGEIVGVALERDRTTWLVPVAVLSELADLVFGAQSTSR